MSNSQHFKLINKLLNNSTSSKHIICSVSYDLKKSGITGNYYGCVLCIIDFKSWNFKCTKGLFIWSNLCTSQGDVTQIANLIFFGKNLPKNPKFI